MTQCELWTDHADLEEQEHRLVRYSYPFQEYVEMVAEPSVPYGKK